MAASTLTNHIYTHFHINVKKLYSFQNNTMQTTQLSKNATIHTINTYLRKNRNGSIRSRLN